mgnify:FL=1|tara:strand:- start:1459 stop:2436 length:978 start_codon:yes stop_codon:yes gene_type:complete
MDSTNFPIFDLKQLEITEEDNGNKYYIIPANTKIYRGGFPGDMQSNAFFGFNVDHVKQYGSVTEYTINRDLKVLALMEMDETSNFYTSATPNIKNALEESFLKINEDGNRIRDSIPAYDYAVVNYLCKKGFQGYAMHDGYKTDSKGTFHAEIVICNCFDTVNMRKKISQEAPRLKKRSRSYIVENRDISPPKLSFIDFDNLNSPVTTPVGTPVGTSVGTPVGTPVTTPIGNILIFDSPNGPISAEKEKLGNNSPQKNLLFGSPNHEPVELKNDYDEQGEKENKSAKIKLKFGGGKRKTKRRNKKTKRRKTRTKRRRNRRTKKVKH